MKYYKIIVITLFLLSIFYFAKVNALVKELPLLGTVIYLDAGHGGLDVGAIKGNIYEKNINLEIVKKLANKLGDKGAIVYLTRDGDYDLANINQKNRKRSDLSKRAKLINESNANLYISIHLNSTIQSNWRGLQIFYNSINEENYNFAKVMNDTLSSKMSTVREIKKDNNYYMYKQINVTGILIEAGFISNPEDLYLLKKDSYQDKLTTWITEGVIKYL